MKDGRREPAHKAPSSEVLRGAGVERAGLLFSASALLAEHQDKSLACLAPQCILAGTHNGMVEAPRHS